MISHEHKCIFIHIPKTAGTSILSFFYPNITFKTGKPDYDRLFGWCPERRIHMQHATSKTLLETGLISQEVWNTYFKFTFVRNPWDKSYSDYIWMQKFAGVKGSFKNYIEKEKEFKSILTDNSNHSYLGDHLMPQSEFFDLDGKYALDYVGRFENFSQDISTIMKKLDIAQDFNKYENKGTRKSDYSLFYKNSDKRRVDRKYKVDIENFNYTFEDNRKGIQLLKRLI
ncbi:sulfotransferase family 2 domain-containing protein [Constantimarinum furrinae]|uniref:Sulfotransferase family protein n=1 Tax=Constantimarinum furrinae TaxID=2562285 RepID=A0A7G8PQU9_9FLAO|nr:sulfotransferase family 2 domain-containing protein [Constantimarinum furrinae]QNJ96715.1 Sulfotransferase family protein [Constantimarinum furrinae]